MNKATSLLVRCGAMLLPMYVTALVLPAVALAQAADEKKTETSAVTKSADAKPVGDSAAGKEDAEADRPSVYLMPLEGEFGRRISPQSLVRVLADVKKNQPDYLILYFNMEWAFGGQQVNADAASAEADSLSITWNNGLFSATEMSTLLIDSIRDDKQWKKKPRVIGWVNKAMGPSAFLAFGFKELYYHPDAHHGGLGYTDFMFKGSDETARQKQISLRLGEAKGMGEKGCFDGKIVQAMADTSTVLSMTMEGGEPKLFMDDTGEILLTDDGKEGNRDTLQDIKRGLGNDVLTLSADTALKLKISKGTVASSDELLEQLGIIRNAKKVDGRSDKIFNEWESEVRRAETEIADSMRDYRDVRPERDTPNARSEARDRQISLLRKALNRIEKYSKCLNPRVLAQSVGSGSADQCVSLLKDQIELLKQMSR